MSFNPADEEQQEILLGFVEEGREMIDEAEPLIIDLERIAEEAGEIDLEMVNTVFRLFHSLKGGAGFLDLTTISSVTHEAETLLDMFRKGKAKLESHHIDLMNRSCDFLRSLLDQIESEFHDHGREEEAESIKSKLVEAIEQLKGSESGEASKQTGGQEATDSAQEPPAPTEAIVAPAEEPKADAEIDLADFQLTVTPEMVETFVAEGNENLEMAESALLDLEKSPGEADLIQQAFRAFHSFKGNCGFLGYRDMERLSHGSESVLDLIREGKLELESKVANLILEIIDFLRSAVSGLVDGKSPNIPATPGLLHLLEDYSGTSIEPAKKTPKPAAPPAAVKVPEPVPAETAKEAPPKPAEKPAESAKKEAPKAKSAAKESAGDTPKRSTSATQRQSVRVDVEKLDVLLDLVGELVISEAMVAQNPDLHDIDIPMERFEKAVMQLDKITRDLQDVSMSIRMIPLSGTFRRMIRLVRDLSQKAGKKVDLQIEGEETEVDKTVIEQITDPLVHIIRNALDHGLETPDERTANGKDPTGTLKLEAKYVGGEVWINIVDNGRGLNHEKIMNKAVERGILDKDPSEYKPEEIWQMIFHPGFSTADKITDVSGRGVGMDVVKRNIESIRGKVDIRSEQGKGSTFTLRIPLTLAIIDGMIVRIGQDRYTIPINAIRESLQAADDMVTRTMDGQEIIRVRENLYPIVRLHELLDIDRSYRPPLEEGIIMIVEDEGQVICLFVDELLGQQQIVIKGLSDYIGNHRCISGCTILGDGDISLIVDVAGVLSYAQELSPNHRVAFAENEIPKAKAADGGNGQSKETEAEPDHRPESDNVETSKESS